MMFYNDEFSEQKNKNEIIFRKKFLIKIIVFILFISLLVLYNIFLWLNNNRRFWFYKSV